MVEFCRITRGVLLAAAALIAAGCAGANPGAQAPVITPTLPSEGATADPLTPPNDLSEPATPAPAVAPGPWRDVTVMPWELLWRDDSSRQLGVRYLPAAGCQHPLGVAVQETGTTVLIGPLAAKREGPCPAVAFGPAAATIQLAAPLGDRTLLHAPPPPELADALDN